MELLGGKSRMSLKSKVSSATKAAVKVLTPAPDAPEDSDILKTLKREHDEVSSLLKDLQDADTASQRRGLVQKIKAALIPHTKAEEKVVYDAVLGLRDKEAQIAGHEGYLEHEWASKTLQRLQAIQNATSPEHKATAKVLKELVEHHIREEENNIWTDVKDNFSDEQRIQMNVAFERAKARVRPR
jgi:hemerythrin-like domain-containing protein